MEAKLGMHEWDLDCSNVRDVFFDDDTIYFFSILPKTEVCHF